MKSKLPLIRQIGQLPLPPSFINKTQSSDSNQDESKNGKPSKKNSSISLSDFLNRKLVKDANPPKPIIQEKKRPFSSMVEQEDVLGVADNHVGSKMGEAVIDEKVFQLFKHPRKENEVSQNPSDECGVGQSTMTEASNSRPRNPFGVSSTGSQKRSTTPRHFVILGDDPKPKWKRRRVDFIPNKKPRPLYNHYANGSGWWDCDMEGIDSEEVGCSDAWEGMGATTNLGGLDWH